MTYETDIKELIIAAIFLFAVLIPVIYLSNKKLRKTIEFYKNIAQQTGLTYKNDIFPPSSRAEGTYKSHEVFIGETEKISGRSLNVFFTIEVAYIREYIDHPHFVITEKNTIYEENFSTPDSRWGDAQEKQTDKIFDERFLISGSKNIDYLKQFLAPIKLILLSFPRHFELIFNPTEVIFTIRKKDLDTKFSEQEAIIIFQNLLKIAEIFESRK